MKKLWIGAALLAAVGAGIWWSRSPAEPPAPTPEDARPAPKAQPTAPPVAEASPAAPTPTAQAPQAAPDPTEPPPAPAEMKARYAPPGDDDNPVVGLSLQPLGEAERARLRVPDKYGRGLRITKIHPDAPAAEAGLKVDDVIVRAQRVNVDALQQLRDAAVSVKHPLIVFVREGALLTAVLHPPYRPEREAGRRIDGGPQVR